MTKARTQMHSFSLKPVEEAVDEGLNVTDKVGTAADHALAEYKYRRIWLAASLMPILLVVVLLLLYIRKLPVPNLSAAHGH